MVENRGLKISGGKAELTTAQKEILHLISDEFLTIKQTAQRRGCSIQAVYKIIKKLKQKGAFGIGLNKVEKSQSTYTPTLNQDIRLHGQEFNIKILWQDNRYQRELAKSNVMFLDSNTIRLYKNSIEVYSGQSFYGKDEKEADKKGFDYWQHFFARLEHDLSIILVKQRARNILEVNHHYARGNSEIYENARANKERIWVFAEEDEKLCFITDDSFGFKEDECVHPITAKPDRGKIDPYINDFRLRNPPTNSQIATLLGENALQLTKLSKLVVEDIKSIFSGLKEDLQVYHKENESHIALIKEYRKENVLWRRHQVKELKKQLKYGIQTTLKDFT